MRYLLAVLLAAAVPSTSLATSGRTNAQGCHNSKKVGYHCHGTPKAKGPIKNPTPVSPPRYKKEAPRAIPKVDQARPGAQAKPQ